MAEMLEWYEGLLLKETREACVQQNSVHRMETECE